MVVVEEIVGEVLKVFLENSWDSEQQLVDIVTVIDCCSVVDLHRYDWLVVVVVNKDGDFVNVVAFVDSSLVDTTFIDVIVVADLCLAGS